MAARFSHLAGAPVLDVVNTVDWRLDADRAIEQLVDMESVLEWCHESGVIDAAEHAALLVEAHDHPRRADAAARRFRELREAAYAALVDHDERAMEMLADYQREAHSAARLVPRDARWVWQDRELTLTTPTHRVARELAELMRSDRIDRLHQCEDDVCGWVYLDTSPRRNRRWCAASDCGDRNRARAYYRRQKQGNS